MLRGAKIGLRPMQTEDVWHLFKWFNDQQVLENIGRRSGLFCVSVEEERAAVEMMLTSPTNRDFMVIDLGTDMAVGWAGLSEIDLRHASARLEIVIGDPSEWDQGKGTEATRMVREHAFEVMNLHRLHLRVPCRNARAVTCFMAGGFIIEGTLRDDHFHRGRFASSYVMGALRDEGGRY